MLPFCPLKIMVYIVVNTGSTGCGTEITTPGTIFTSTNYPNDYPNNEDCSTVIRFEEGEIISLEFLAFCVEGHSSCG